MSSFSIDIFDNDSYKLESYLNTSIIPSFNNNIGESTNKLNFRPESSSNTHDNPVSSIDERFKQNQLINGKTRYEQDNTIIKSLEEEIVNMKHKLSFVYEKDEEIGKLKEEINGLKKQLEDAMNYSIEVVNLRNENNKLTEQIVLLQQNINDLTNTNNVLEIDNNNLKDEILNLQSKINSLDHDNDDSNKLLILQSKIKSLEDELKQKTNILAVRDNIEIEEIDEMININLPHLREVLTNRLKTKQLEHIETLIETYGLKRTNKVKKSIMEKMLEEAIHI